MQCHYVSEKLLNTIHFLFSSIYSLTIPYVLELQLVKERKHFVILLTNFFQEFRTQYATVLRHSQTTKPHRMRMAKQNHCFSIVYTITALKKWYTNPIKRFILLPQLLVFSKLISDDDWNLDKMYLSACTLGASFHSQAYVWRIIFMISSYVIFTGYWWYSICCRRLPFPFLTLSFHSWSCHSWLYPRSIRLLHGDYRDSSSHCRRVC